MKIPKIFRRKRRERADGEMRIAVSPIMLLMAVYFVAVGMAYEFVCTLSAVMLHECAHAKVAKKLGYELNVIKLMPYGAALCGDASMTPRHEALIAVAGPLFNLSISLVFAALWWLVPSSYLFTQAFCCCNLYIGVFNLLPVYPLDGGRIALSLLSLKLKRGKAYFIMRIVSAVAGLVAVGLFVWSAFYTPNICLLSVGLFMIISALIPDMRAKYTTLFSLEARRTKLSAPTEIKRFAVSDTAELAALVGMLDSDKYCEFDILNDNLEFVGTFTETELTEAIKVHGYTATAGKVMEI